MLAKYGRGSISIQSPVTYQWYECKTGFEFVMAKTYLFLFDIVAIAANGKPLLKWTPQFFLSSAAILLVDWSANGDCSVLPSQFQGQFTK